MTILILLLGGRTCRNGDAVQKDRRIAMLVTIGVEFESTGHEWSDGQSSPIERHNERQLALGGESVPAVPFNDWSRPRGRTPLAPRAPAFYDPAAVIVECANDPLLLVFSGFDAASLTGSRFRASHQSRYDR